MGFKGILTPVLQGLTEGGCKEFPLIYPIYRPYLTPLQTIHAKRLCIRTHTHAYTRVTASLGNRRKGRKGVRLELDWRFIKFYIYKYSYLIYEGI